MTIKQILGITFFFLAVFASSTNAADICREKADAALKNIKTWQDLRSWYENYPECDDGYFAEGISDFVVTSLAKQWHTLSALQQAINRNSSFKGFVMKHIDSTTDENNLRLVAHNAKAKCPSTLLNLCGEIKKNTQAALKEEQEIKK